MEPMMTKYAVSLAPDEMPVPFGIEAETGNPLPGLTKTDLEHIDPDRDEVKQRGERGVADHLAIADIDPNNLAESGWCVLFAKDADPAIKKALDPLLRLRESQAGPLFKVFENTSGMLPGEDARAWIERQGAGFSVVDPAFGVPLYVLLVGSPEEIPFEFQYLLDLYWSVGRLHFDKPEEYARYAENVVAYETASTVPNKKNAVLFSVRNDGDRATGLLHDEVVAPMVSGTGGVRTLAGIKGFQVTPFLAEAATKVRLTSIMAGKEPGGVPPFLFTGSHGLKFKMADPEQREKQGAILCQEWPGFGPAAPEHMFTAADIPSNACLNGMVHFFFACYGGGCPPFDNFGLNPGESPRPLVPSAILARLPQRMLLQGALASFAHVDRAWAYSFQNSSRRPQTQEMRNIMVRILQGQRLGQAIDDFNMRWAALSAELQESMNKHESFGDQLVSSAELANRYVARNDARNYIVIGDPAVQLRESLMKA